MFGGTDRRELTRYFTLSQVGLEMVVPVVLGLLIDRYLNSSPWAVSAGAVLGLTIGLVHLVKVANTEDEPAREGKDSEPPR